MVVADYFVDLIGQKIAHRPFHQVGLFENARGRRLFADLLFDPRPLLEEEAEVANEITGTLSFPNGADDDPESLGNVELAQNLAQTRALFRILDLARNAAAIAEGHEDQIATGETKIGRNARPFASDRSFRHLHDDFGADRIDTRDILGRQAFLILFPIRPLDFLDAAVERGGDRIPKMEEGIFLESDVDEHRLQTGLDVFDPSFVNASGDVAGAVALDAILLELAVLEQSDAAFEFLHADDYFVAGLAMRQAKNSFHLFDHGAANFLKSSR